MRIFAAVDIGGTAIKYGVVDETGTVLSSYETETEAAKGSVLLVSKVENIITQLIAENPEISGIGVSTAGVVDSKNGRIVYANDNMPGYTGTEWAKPLKAKFSLPVIVNNDVNSAAFAEAWVGAAKNVENFSCITIGTGIGGAAFINGRLITGAHDRAAEIGNMIIDDSGDRFEKCASTAALVRMAEQRSGMSGLDGKIVFKKVREGEKIYCEVFGKWLENLCRGIAILILMLDPAMIVIGGGISREGDYLINKIKEGLLAVLPDGAFLENIVIQAAECKNSAGMIGAVYGFVHSDI